uniref:Uncharacterized protein n=1 Tax=Plectus sambesii TaxID=2011161 RepID=A0A914VI74_9BILA
MIRQPAVGCSVLGNRLQRICVRCFATKPPENRPSLSESKFSESKAFRGGRAKDATPLSRIPDLGDYYDTINYRRKKNISLLVSVMAFMIYFFILREENDLDETINQPPWVMVPRLERDVIRRKIARARLAGENTTDLEKELASLDKKEERLKEQWRLQGEQRTSW